MLISSAPAATVPAPQSPPASAPVEPTGPVLAQFSYAIRGPKQLPKIGVIEARAWPTAPVAIGGGFDDAVAAAKLAASKAVSDGMHGLPIHQAHGVLQGVDGAFSIVPLGGFHRETNGPIFIDGRYFEAAALSMQVTRSVPELVAVVGSERVLDLRFSGAAFIVSRHADKPTSTTPPHAPHS